MRKYLYLITEHDDPGMVGLVKLTGSPIAHAKKNEERVIQTLNIEELEQGNVDRGTYQCVGLGYADFEDEADYEERIEEVVKRKLTEIDGTHLEKAGVSPEAVVA